LISSMITIKDKRFFY